MSAYQRLLKYEVTQNFTDSHNKNAEAQEEKMLHPPKCFILNPQFCQWCWHGRRQFLKSSSGVLYSV